MLNISFFSYKGGAGRSSIAYNTIPLIAKNLKADAEHPVIVVDMDIDSAGMTFLLRNESDNYSEDNKYFMTDKLLAGNIPGFLNEPEETPLSSHPLFSRLYAAGKDYGLDDERAVLFIGANPGAGIAGDSTTFDHSGNPLMNLNKLCKRYNCSALILDTPTGDQLTAKWSMRISKYVVCCMRITKQFTVGTLNYLVRKDSEYEDKTYFLVPNAVPQERIVVDGEEYSVESNKSRLLTTLENKKPLIKNNNIDLSMVEGETFGIPEVKRFKIKEGILYKLEKLQPDEEQALACFSHLADLICSR